MNRTKCLFILSLLLALHTTVRADIVPGAPFRDGLILQRGKPVSVWGTGLPGEPVQIEFAGQTQKTVTDEHGHWLVKLNSLEASTRPSSLVIHGKNTVTIQDVLVGEVWLCSGQSNMNFPLHEAANAQREIAEANYPLIRQFTVRGVVSDQPQATAPGEWKTCSPATAAEFIAVGYFFARDLHRALGVPIGIVKATLGGSPIEGWLSEETLASDPAFAVVATRWKQLQPRVEAGNRNQPAGLYNGLIRPLEPLALAGIVWYQGEGNFERANEYSLLLGHLIEQGRSRFQQADLPFLLVQLPNYLMPQDKTGRSWAWLRDAQFSVTTKPNVGMVVTVDVGDPANAHPADKQSVGARLALLAQERVYGRKVEASGPVFAGMENKDAALRLRFDHAEGLHFTGDPDRAFEIAGEDRNFVPAQARIEGNIVVVSAPGVLQPVAARLDWTNSPESCLRNGAQLPASPFRTDRW